MKKSEKKKASKVEGKIQLHCHVSLTKGGEISKHGAPHPLDAAHKNKKTQGMHDFTLLNG